MVNVPPNTIAKGSTNKIAIILIKNNIDVALEQIKKFEKTK